MQDATLVDAFEEVTELPTNASRSLLALPVTCPAGFCLGGAGISFVATSPTAVAPRLPVSELGLAPAFVLFK